MKHEIKEGRSIEQTKWDNNDEGKGEINKSKGRKEWRVIKQRKGIRAKYDYSQVNVKRNKN